MPSVNVVNRLSKSGGKTQNMYYGGAGSSKSHPILATRPQPIDAIEASVHVVETRKNSVLNARLKAWDISTDSRVMPAQVKQLCTGWTGRRPEKSRLHSVFILST
jgi:hypothetical protein